MWSSAVIDLRLTEDQFFFLTPAKLDALCVRQRYQVEREEVLFGQLTAMVVNTSQRAPEKPMSIEDFMPSKWGSRKPQRKAVKVRMTKKRIMHVAAGFRAFVQERILPHVKN